LLGVFLEEGSLGAALLRENQLTQGQLELEAARSAAASEPVQTPPEPPASRPDPSPAVVRDLSAAARAGTLSPLVGRQREMDRIIHILSRRTRNNPLLVGEPGVGKTALLEGVAQRIAEYNVPATLEGRPVFIVDASSLIAPSRRGRFEELPHKLISQIPSQRRVILCVDGLLDLAASPGWGAVEATHVLEVLSRSEIQCIATGTPAGYRRAFDHAGMLVRHFEVVEVPPPTEEEAVAILTRLKPQYEQYHGVEFGEGVIEAAVLASSRFLPQRRLPDRAIDLIDDAGARVKVRAERPQEEMQAKRRADQLHRDKEDALALQEHARENQLAEEERQEREKLRLLREAREMTARPPQTVTIADLEEAIAERVGVPVESVREVLAQKKGKGPQALAQKLADAVGPDQHAWLPFLASYLAGCSAEEAERLAQAIRAGTGD